MPLSFRWVRMVWIVPSCSCLRWFGVYVFRTDNQQVLARGLLGYDAAREKVNQIRLQQGLKWDQVSFKSERNPLHHYSITPDWFSIPC